MAARGARPWRLATVGMEIRPEGGGESQVAADTLSRMFAERATVRHGKWLETKRNYPRDWQAVAEQSQYAFYLTSDELRQLNEDVAAVLISAFQKYRDRMENPAARPAGSAPVELLVRAYPVGLPSDAAASDDA